MIELINNNANVCTFEEAREIIKVLLYEKIENQYIKEIKEKLLKNNNYNIRRITNRYLTKQLYEYKMKDTIKFCTFYFYAKN